MIASRVLAACAAASLTLVSPAFAGTLYRCLDGTRIVITDTTTQLKQCAPLAANDGNIPVRSTPTPAAVPAPAPVPMPAPVTPVPVTPGPPIEQPSTAASGDVAVPVQRAGNLLVVSAKLNGNRDARLILDTGASHTIVSRDVARDLGILNDGFGNALTLKTAGGQVQATTASLNAIQVGDAEARQVAVAVHDIPDVPPGIDGLLGLTFLNHFLVTLDMQKGELHLKRR